MRTRLLKIKHNTEESLESIKIQIYISRKQRRQSIIMLPLWGIFPAPKNRGLILCALSFWPALDVSSARSTVGLAFRGNGIR